MKLSKIIENPNLKNVTISVLNPDTVVCDIFIKGKTKPIKKVYKKLDVDINIPDVGNENVKHLGIKKYFHLVKESFYINLYYY